MSTAAAQARIFYEQVVRDDKVFTLQDGDGLLVFPVKSLEVIPFWSSRSRLESLQAKTPKFSRYEIHETSFKEFFENTLPWLKEEGVHIGLNWSGERLAGYDVSVESLCENLKYFMGKA